MEERERRNKNYACNNQPKRNIAYLCTRIKFNYARVRDSFNYCWRNYWFALLNSCRWCKSMDAVWMGTKIAFSVIPNSLIYFRDAPINYSKVQHQPIYGNGNGKCFMNVIAKIGDISLLKSLPVPFLAHMKAIKREQRFVKWFLIRFKLKLTPRKNIRFN